MNSENSQVLDNVHTEVLTPEPPADHPVDCEAPRGGCHFSRRHTPRLVRVGALRETESVHCSSLSNLPSSGAAAVRVVCSGPWKKPAIVWW